MRGRRFEIEVKYAVIGRNIYSYLLYKMLGKNCIVINNKQPVYAYSYDYIIYPTYHVSKFFDYYMIDYREYKLTIGSVNRFPNKEYLQHKLKDCNIHIPDIPSDPFTVNCILPYDIFSKYYIDDEIEKIKILTNHFHVYLKNNKNVIRCEKILNTLPLIEFLKLIPELKHLLRGIRYSTTSKLTFIAMDLREIVQKTKYDLNFDFNSYNYDCYRKAGNIVLGECIARHIKQMDKRFNENEIIEHEKYFLFNPELNKKTVIKNIYNIGRYAQVVNNYSLDDFIIDVSKFEDDDVYSTGLFDDNEGDDSYDKIN